MLKELGKDLSVVHLDEIGDVNKIFSKSSFVSLTKTGDEISLIIETEFVEDGWNVNNGWKAIYIVGPLDFSLVGILKEVLSLLADGGVSIFAISTFDTDYILIKDQQMDRALNILKKQYEIS